MHHNSLRRGAPARIGTTPHVEDHLSLAVQTRAASGIAITVRDLLNDQPVILMAVNDQRHTLCSCAPT